MFDRLGGTSFFIPGGLVISDKQIAHSGGSPILWQHLFWFFGHPEVYIAILPGMGVTSQLFSTFARKPIYGYRAMVYAVFAIGLMGFFVWGHHMFISGLSPMSALVFSMLTLTIGVPSAVKTFNWLGTLWGGKYRFCAASLYAVGFVSLVCVRRHYRDFSRSDFDRHPVARHLFPGRSFPSDHGCCGHLRDLRRDLLLVPQNVWPHDERNAWARFISG